MSDILIQYDRVPAITWVYLSSLLTIGLFFKFSRFWSIRNLDLVALILLAPGMLLVLTGRATAPNQNPSADSAEEVREGAAPRTVALAAADQPHPPTTGQVVEHVGYIWLFVVGGFLLVRLLLDPAMIRRPLLEPNLTAGGMTFLGLSLLIFLMANVLTGPMTEDDLVGPKAAERLQTGEAASADDESTSLERHGPGFPTLFFLPKIVTSGLLRTDAQSPREQREMVFVATARTMALLSQLAVVLGIVLIGYQHFDNIRTGIAAAALYLLLPYTAQMTGRVDHVLPAALLVWAVLSYRLPLVSGLLMGLAIGVVYYPAFLLPLWISFYWARGLKRFVGGVAVTLAILTLSLAFTSSSFEMFLAQARQMFGWRSPLAVTADGFWRPEFQDQVFRMPVLVLFVVMCISFAIWPAQKNLGTLMSCSAAIMLGTQFWHAHGGGLFMAWYLPLTLLTVFRPNLEDRVALSVLGEGWLARRRTQLWRTMRAA